MTSNLLTKAISSVAVFEGELRENDCTILTVHKGTPAFDAVLSFAPLHEKELAAGTSFEILNNNATREDWGGDEEKKEKVSTVRLTPGMGVHTTKWEDSKIFIALRAVGPPVGTNCGAQIYQFLTLAVQGKNKQGVLQNFIDHAIEEANKCPDTQTIRVYTWHTRYQYWKQERRQLKRPISTIILDKKKMEMIVEDIGDFKKAKKWYYQHGIPYKRCYMLYGPPGTGKSSTIRAIASHFDRALCFLQPSDSNCTDESFKKAIELAPKNALIAIEDIDALFGKDRKTLNTQCPLTFSGLLNGIDGIGSPNGQIIVMTTNFPDRLDSALTRAGRCDLSVELNHASQAQTKAMFLRFYPGKEEEAERFAKLLTEVKCLSMASLQNHFIIHRKSTAKEVVDGLCIVDGNIVLLAKGEKPPNVEKAKKIAEEESNIKKEKETPRLPDNPTEWTSEHVVRWAKENKELNHKISHFLKKEDLDGSMLLEYNMDMMTNDNLRPRGDRIRLHRAIQKLKTMQNKSSK
mmetsp:Transcript_9423/g.15239  ORF Transcript_9423/g.15239 Transcript_9423/m.15239 type:complete len:518 (-) Transcript_9423:104-1657(-)